MQTDPQSRPLNTALSARKVPTAPVGSDEWTIVPLDPFRAILKVCGVHVISEHKAQIACPGLSLHNSPTAADSCVILYNGRWLRAHCFRNCCRQNVLALNRKLYRLSGGKADSLGLASSAAPQSQQDLATRDTWRQKRHEREKLERNAVALFPSIQKECHWPANAIKADSPVAITSSAHRHHYYILDLFEDDDVLWCADKVNRTGKTQHEKHFRRMSRWKATAAFPGAFTCPSTFALGSFSRSEANVANRKFFVVESDDVLDRDHVGAVFRWLDKHLGLPLRAVVDTGRRSLHGWFQYPSERLLEKLMIVLPAFGCDPAMFRPVQPCRMPGVIRPETGRWQELLYLAPPSAGLVNTSAATSSSGGSIAI